MLLDVSDVAAVGLGCDVAGGYLLAKGLLLRPAGLFHAATVGGIESRFLDVIEDRALASVGLLALLGGFALQAVAITLTLAVGTADDPSWSRGVVALALAAIAAGAVLLYERRTRPRRLRKLIVAAAGAGHDVSAKTALHVLVRGAERLGEERRAGEEDRDYVARVFGAAALPPVSDD